MLTYKTVVTQSPIHGLGCFAAEPIPKGAAVWVYKEGWDFLVPENIPHAASDFADKYGFPIKEGRLIPGDNARYINHSESPLLTGGPGKETFYAVRDIEPGEELLEDYRQFNALNFG